MTVLCYIDTETTGLDPDVHQAYEVAWQVGHGPLMSARLRHTLANADEFALSVGRYHERGFAPKPKGSRDVVDLLRRALDGVTLVGSNPAFDAAFLRKSLGCAPWHHRLINVAEGGMWVFGWDRPKGLADVAAACRERGYDIPEPDHTAEGDVRATRAVYEALRAIRAGMGASA